MKIAFLFLVLITSIFLLGCTETSIPGIPFTANQFFGRTTDLNYQKFVAGDYNGLFLVIDQNKITAVDGNEWVGATDWNNLSNFPSGCGANQAVQIIGDTLTCVSVPSQFWERVGTDLSPATSGDTVTADGGLTIGVGTTEQIDWPSGNTIFVPIGGDIETYVASASSGDTLQLASGTYTLPNTLTINTKVHIKGAGREATTLTYDFSSSADAIENFANGTEISNLKLELTGNNGGVGITTATDIYVHDVSILLNGFGGTQFVGFKQTGSSYYSFLENVYSTDTYGSPDNPTFIQLSGGELRVANVVAEYDTSAAGATASTVEVSGGTLITFHSFFYFDSGGSTNASDALYVSNGQVVASNSVFWKLSNGGYDVEQTGGAVNLYNVTLGSGKTTGTINDNGVGFAEDYNATNFCFNDGSGCLSTLPPTTTITDTNFETAGYSSAQILLDTNYETAGYTIAQLLLDTNAETACSGTQYLAGNGSCLTPSSGTDTNWQTSWSLFDTNMRATYGVPVSSSRLPFGEVYLSTTTAPTTITTGGTFYKLAGTTIIGNKYNFDMNANNRLRYIGDGNVGFKVTAIFSYRGNNANDDMAFRLAKNGTTIVKTGNTQEQWDDVDDLSQSVSGVVYLTNGDYVELWGTSSSNGKTITLTRLNMIAQPIDTNAIVISGSSPDVSNLVPYTGANKDTNLGNYNLTAKNLVSANDINMAGYFRNIVPSSQYNGFILTTTTTQNAPIGAENHFFEVNKMTTGTTTDTTINNALTSFTLERTQDVNNQTGTFVSELINNNEFTTSITGNVIGSGNLFARTSSGLINGLTLGGEFRNTETLFNSSSGIGIGNYVSDMQDLNKTGQTATFETKGINNYIVSSGSQINGTLIKNIYGLYNDMQVNNEGTSTAYGIYLTNTGFTQPDTGYDIFSTTGWDWVLGSDLQKLLFGVTQDASIYYDGTDLVINPDEVGSGKVKIDGNVLMQSPDSTWWNCGVTNGGVFQCT